MGKDVAEIKHIPIDQIKSVFFERTEIDTQEYDELKDNILRNGITVPIIVRQFNDGYQVIAGTIRYMIAKQLGLKTVPAMIVNISSDEEAFKILFSENLRVHMTPVDKGRVILELKKRGHSLSEIAELLGISKSRASELLKIVEAPKEIVEKVESGQISTNKALKMIKEIEKKREEEKRKEKIAERIEQLRAELEKIEELKRKREELKAHLRSITLEIDELKRKSQQLDPIVAKVIDYNTNYLKKAKEYDSIAKNIDFIKFKIRNILATIGEENPEEAMSKLEKERDKVAKELGRVEAKIEELESKIRELRNERWKLQSRLEEIDTAYRALKKYTEDLSKQEKKAKELKEELDKLEKKYEEVKKNLNEYMKAVADKQEIIERLAKLYDEKSRIERELASLRTLDAREKRIVDEIDKLSKLLSNTS